MLRLEGGVAMLPRCGVPDGKKYYNHHRGIDEAAATVTHSIPGLYEAWPPSKTRRIVDARGDYKKEARPSGKVWQP
eukprot:gene11376-1678_t